jgi:hypothetical protein
MRAQLCAYLSPLTTGQSLPACILNMLIKHRLHYLDLLCLSPILIIPAISIFSLLEKIPGELRQRQSDLYQCVLPYRIQWPAVCSGCCYPCSAQENSMGLEVQCTMPPSPSPYYSCYQSVSASFTWKRKARHRFICNIYV